MIQSIFDSHTRRCIVKVLSLVLMCVVVVAPASAQAPLASEPQLAFPVLPDIGEDPPTILDIEDAPPITREAIMQLVVLGVYPLTSEMLALPNVLLDAATAAFMIVNAFAPRAAAQYPVPAEAAFGVLTVLTGTDLQPADLVDVGTFRGLIITVVEVEAGLGAEVAASLDEQYPALIAGNPGAPLTRAGAALMTAIGLDALSRQAD